MRTDGSAAGGRVRVQFDVRCEEDRLPGGEERIERPTFGFMLPVGAEVVGFEVDDHGLWLELELPPDAERAARELRAFRIDPSEHPEAQGEVIHRGAARSPDGASELHLFECGPPVEMLGFEGVRVPNYLLRDDFPTLW